jgi:hypothetical protein
VSVGSTAKVIPGGPSGPTTTIDLILRIPSLLKFAFFATLDVYSVKADAPDDELFCEKANEVRKINKAVKKVNPVPRFLAAFMINP